MIAHASFAGMTEKKLTQILTRQTPDAEKRAQAHFVIETGKDLNHAFEQVKAVVQQLRDRKSSGRNA